MFVIASASNVIAREVGKAAGRNMSDDWIVPCLVIIGIVVVIGVLVQKNK